MLRHRVYGMRLKEYLDSKPRGELARLQERSGVTYGTIWNLANKPGEVLKTYDTAKRLSDATGGAVTIAELCELPPPKRKRAAGEARR